MKTIDERLENFARGALVDFNNWGAIENLTVDEILTVMKSHDNYTYYYEEVSCGYETHDGYGVDTCVRDAIFDDVAIFYISEPWPLNCEDRDFKTFHKKLVNRIEKWKPLHEWECSKCRCKSFSWCDENKKTVLLPQVILAVAITAKQLAKING